MELEQLLATLDYKTSTYYVTADSQNIPELAPLLRFARRMRIHGMYVFRSSSDEPLTLDSIDPGLHRMRPAVFVAQADTLEQARQIHRSVWNLGQIPFLIILLPDQIRIYTGFEYSVTREHEHERGLVSDPIRLSVGETELSHLLKDFAATSIDSGAIWDRRSHHLRPDYRVDNRLLVNLEQLAKELTKQGLKNSVANALIGKYVYLRYLRDRNILSDAWLRENTILLEEVFGRTATVEGLQKTVNAIEKRFNGNIFPINFSGVDAPTNEHVSLVASIFLGDNLVTSTRVVLQLHMDFKAYDFQYIPIELLSAIYEQFMHEQGLGRDVGAIYTPEILADYLLSEVMNLDLLKRGDRVLDPTCGSGVFLVLAYRKLIEMELAALGRNTLKPVELRAILQQSLFGVERAEDACYVAEFSLILTMLSYIEPPELHRNKQFQFPRLHNNQIFHCDFFDDDSDFWKKGRNFDLVIGNPPWFELKKSSSSEPFLEAWLKKNQQSRWVSDKRVSEAFSWRVTDIVKPNGHMALILPAKTLYNQKAQRHREQFFTENTVCRITNFSNMRHVLFGGRAIAPAITMIYRKAKPFEEKPPIIHYAPLRINQLTTRSVQSNREPWVILVNSSEIQVIDPVDAASGSSYVWKLALWGSHRDKWAIDQMKELFPLTLVDYLTNKGEGWYIGQGPELKEWNITALDALPNDLEHVPELDGKRLLNVDRMNETGRRLRVPVHPSPFEVIDANRCFRRKRGGGRIDILPPHIVISAAWKYAAYSDIDFIITPRQISITAPSEFDDTLRAISLFLNTRLIYYYLFFQAADWGIERKRINLDNVKNIPLPEFTDGQISKLASIHKHFAQIEQSGELDTQTWQDLDSQVADVLGLPEDLIAIASDFVQVKLTLNQGRTNTIASNSAGKQVLENYATRLRWQLDSFMHESGYRHQVEITSGGSLVVCHVELVKSDEEIPLRVYTRNNNSSPAMAGLQDVLTAQISQWSYVQRSLKVFDGPRAAIYKSDRVIDWLETQAFIDADDLISYILDLEEVA